MEVLRSVSVCALEASSVDRNTRIDVRKSVCRGFMWCVYAYETENRCLKKGKEAETRRTQLTVGPLQITLG